MNAELTSVSERVKVHAALADPVRLAMVDALATGDVSPGELATTLRLPTNLVAHHVKVLQDAGLVARARSEGDRRRTYLRLVPSALATLIPPPLIGVGRVVFVCTRNSARSQLAAALWRERVGGPVASAGTHPVDRVHPRAVEVARRHRLILDPVGTTHLADVVRTGDLLVAVCDQAHEDLAAGSPELRPRLHWSVPDPVRIDTDAAFEAAYTDIAQRIDRLAPAASASIPAQRADP